VIAVFKGEKEQSRFGGSEEGAWKEQGEHRRSKVEQKGDGPGFSVCTKLANPWQFFFSSPRTQAKFTSKNAETLNYRNNSKYFTIDYSRIIYYLYNTGISVLLDWSRLFEMIGYDFSPSVTSRDGTFLFDPRTILLILTIPQRY